MTKHKLKKVCQMVLISLLAVISYPTISAAAEVTLVTDSNCQLSILGEIKQGDFNKIKTISEKSNVQVICLTSNGGSWIEGVKISEYVMNHFWGTYVGRGAECYSVCSIIFLAGARKGKVINSAITDEIFKRETIRLPNRTMHVRAKVGFHAPYLALKQKQYSDQDIQTAHVAALRGFAKFLGMMRPNKSIKNSSQFIPKRFIALAMNKKPDEFLMIDTVDMAGWLNIILVGYKQPKRITKKNLFWALVKLQIWQKDQSTKEFLLKNQRMKKEGYEVVYEPPSSFKSKGDITQGFFVVWLKDSEFVPDYYIELLFPPSGETYLYVGLHEFGTYSDGPRGYPVEVISPAKDKKRLMRKGMVSRLLKTGHEYLLTPTWYIYPAKAKLASIAAD